MPSFHCLLHSTEIINIESTSKSNARKPTQFGTEFIYAFAWEDSRVDQRLLKINEKDVILCLTSAGDNLVDRLASCRPRRIHAVDLNPHLSHFLELKVAAYQALEYVDFWRLLGRGACRL